MQPEQASTINSKQKELTPRKKRNFLLTSVLQESRPLIIPDSFTLAPAIFKVKLPTLVYLASFSLASPLWSAVRQANSALPVVLDQIQRPELAQALTRALQESFASDDEIVVFNPQEKEPHFKIEVQLQHDVRYPDCEAMYCRFTSPQGEERTLTLLYSPEALNQRGISWLAKSGAESICRQLKAEAVVNLAPRLDRDISKNIIRLDVSRREILVEKTGLGKDKPETQREKTGLGKDRRELQVETVGVHKDWSELQDDLSNTKLPISSRHQNLDAPELLSFGQAPPVGVVDPKNPPAKEIPYERLPIQPFKAQVASELERQLTFPYPRFETGGPVALLLTPSLGMPDSDPRFYGTVGTSTSVTSQDFYGRGSGHSFNQLTWNGPLYREVFSVATKLWERLGIGMESGFGQQDAQIEMEIDHPTAPGGTTFLPSGTLDGGMLDTKLFINGLWETPTMLYRPHLVVKVPTGDQNNLLGSGHIDYSLGASLEGYWYNWHVKSMLSYTRPGDLDIFDPRQAPLKTTPYAYVGLGLGRELNAFGGERVSMSLNAMENPLREATNMNDLDKLLVSISGLVEKSFTDSLTLRLEGAYGLTASAADTSLALSAFLRF